MQIKVNLTDGQPSIPYYTPAPIPSSQTEEKKKRGRKKKEDSSDESEATTEGEIVSTTPADNATYFGTPTSIDAGSTANTGSNMVPYADMYKETNQILKTVINELGVSSAQISEDLMAVRGSKTMPKKWDYVSNLQSAKVSTLTAIINATKELNNSINKANDLELKRSKENKESKEIDSAKYMQDMYSAWVSTPVQQNMSNSGPWSSPYGPITQDFTTKNLALGMNLLGQTSTYNIANDQEALLMQISDNQNIKEVVAIDRTTGATDFKYYDQTTNQFIDYVQGKDAATFLPGMEYDWSAGKAFSNDLNQSFDIVYTDVDPYPNRGPVVNTEIDLAPTKDLSNY